MFVRFQDFVVNVNHIIMIEKLDTLCIVIKITNETKTFKFDNITNRNNAFDNIIRIVTESSSLRNTFISGHKYE